MGLERGPVGKAGTQVQGDRGPERFLSRGREVSLAGGKWAGLSPKEARGHPDLLESDCGFPTPCLASRESEGQPRIWSEHGRAPMRLSCGPCSASVSPVLTSGETTARPAPGGPGGWAQEGLTHLTSFSSDPAPCSFQDTHLY